MSIPYKPKKPCGYSGCSKLTTGGPCPEHKRKINRQYDKQRGTSGERGYDATEQKVREIKANQDPLCEDCLKSGIVKPLKIVHHIKPIETHPELRLVMENLMSLCNECHEQVYHKGERFRR